MITRLKTNKDFIDGYDKDYSDAIDERASLLAYICKKYNIPLVDMNCTVDEWEQMQK